jgi:PAS domain S-box-containing protein
LRVAEEELRQQNEALRAARDALDEERRRYRELFDFAPVGYLATDPNGVIQEANRAAAILLQVPQGGLAGKPVVLFVATQDRKRLPSLLAVVAKHERVQDREVWLAPGEGNPFPASVTLDAVRDAQGDLTGLRWLIRDVGERKSMVEGPPGDNNALERQVEACTAELRTSNEQLRSKIAELERAEESLRKAFSEIQTLQQQHQAENLYLREEIKGEHNFDEIIGQSDVLKSVLFRVEQVAPSDATVLILGETGVGKELIARAIHQLSPLNIRPLVKVNCAALPVNLIESELFGHEKGAFTGAEAKRVGRFELAHGGTLFLDEIGMLPLELQTKLLQVLQDGEFERLGSSQTIRVDVRVIAATNQDLEEDVRSGRFRKDLYYRLQVFPITVPPLRDRQEDIPLLVRSFVEKFARKSGKAIDTVPAEALEALQRYPWPGNVRELQNVIERAVINTRGPSLHLMDTLAAPGALGPASPRIRTLAESEAECIVWTLEATDWQIEGQDGAAAALGLPPSTLRKRMQKHGIQRPRKPWK